MRLDQWLWAVRVYKTRSLAAGAIKAAHVTVNGQPAKPAHAVRAGQMVVALAGEITRTLKVIGAPPSRVGAKLVPQFAEDLTPPEELQKKREPNFIPVILRPKGAGRPTKRERRELDDLEAAE